MSTEDKKLTEWTVSTYYKKSIEEVEHFTKDGMEIVHRIVCGVVRGLFIPITTIHQSLSLIMFQVEMVLKIVLICTTATTITSKKLR